MWFRNFVLVTLFDTNSLPSALSTSFHTSISASNGCVAFLRIPWPMHSNTPSKIRHLHRCVQIIEDIVPSTRSEIEWPAQTDKRLIPRKCMREWKIARWILLSPHPMDDRSKGRLITNISRAHCMIIMDGRLWKWGFFEEDVPWVPENSQSITPKMRGDVSASTIIIFWEWKSPGQRWETSNLRNSYSAGMNERRNHAWP